MAKKTFPLALAYQLLEPGPVVMLTTAYQGKTDIMTMSWLMPIDFEPPLAAIVVSNRNYSFKLLTGSKECVINIPTAELAKQVVGVGNTRGSTTNKFKKFNLTPLPAKHVKAPLIEECYANLECKIIDAHLADKYNIFFVEVVKAWITPSKKRQRTLHHCGNGVFTIDGKIIKLASDKK